MPHVTVKLWPGKSEEQKRQLADAISKDVMNLLSRPRCKQRVQEKKP